MAALRPTKLDVVMAVIPAVLTIIFAFYIPTIAAGETVRYVLPWVPGLDVNLSFYIDGLSLLFALLISGVGFFIFMYSGAYLAGHPHIRRFYLYIFLFKLAMLGLVLADNIVTLFVFWELTTLTSYLLIGYDADYYKSRWSALQALLVTTVGGLAMLAGLVMAALVTGSWELTGINAASETLQEHSLYVPILLLILLGTFTKSAQMPFHFWLPNAMAAPTPVSAFLHSATMVKAGVYLMARMQPALGGTDWWLWILLLFGGVTTVWASLLALRQRDLKLMMAYTTLMALGTLTMLLAADLKYAATAVMAFILVHSLYKAALFLVVGIIDHEAGTRDLEGVAGLRKSLPYTFVSCVLVALSMAGIPPFIGFIGKELIYAATTSFHGSAVLASLFAIAANAMMVAIAGAVAIKPFTGTFRAPADHVHEAPRRMWSGPAVLAALSLICGLGYALIGPGIMEPGASAIRGGGKAYSPHIGFNLPLLLSVVTLIIGVGIYRFLPQVRAGLDRTIGRLPAGDDVYDRCVAGVIAFAHWQTRILQPGVLNRYIFVVYAALVVLVGFTFVYRGAFAWPDAQAMAYYEFGIVGLVIAATIVTVLMRSRLGAICALGVSSSGIAIIFATYGAADVAITQMMVDVLIIVVLAVILPKLPGFRGVVHATRVRQLRDSILAGATGLVVTLLMLAVSATPFDRFMTDYFEQASYPDAHGQNIVNVILVDFRALDTFGEIVVVGMAGIGCYALIKLKPRRRGRPSPKGGAAAAGWAPGRGGDA